MGKKLIFRSLALQKSPRSTKKVAASGGQPRTTLPEEWAFLQERSTPTKPGRPSSPMSLLIDENFTVTHSPHQGRASMSFLLERSDSTVEEELFVKRVLILSPENANDKAFREQRILSAFKELSEQKLCFNFVTMLLSGTSKDNYLELVLEKGGGTLFHRKSVTLNEMREILFQILYALSVAQRELRFVHYDLHDKNILIENFEPKRGAKITLSEGSEFFMTKILVKIADFALSRIEQNGEEIYNTKNAMRGAFDPSHDLSLFVDCLARLNISDRKKDIEGLKQLKTLRYRMKNSLAGPECLLKHEFFEELKKTPKKHLEFEWQFEATDKVKKAVLMQKTNSMTTRANSPRLRKEIHF